MKFKPFYKQKILFIMQGPGDGAHCIQLISRELPRVFPACSAYFLPQEQQHLWSAFPRGWSLLEAEQQQQQQGAQRRATWET